MGTCGGFIEPLDLQCLFVNTLAGGLEIFIFLAFILIAGLAAYFKMPNSITLSMFGLFTVIMSVYVGFQLYVLAVFLVGITTFWGISKIIK